MSRKRLAVLISGRGSNLQALIEAAAAPDFPADIVLAISNRPDVQGLARAGDAGIATRMIDHKRFGKGAAARRHFDRALSAALAEARPDFVCLAGFMRLLTKEFVEFWRGRVINIHPSLLPAFPGLDAQAQAVAAGVKIAGCTVHFVTAETDAGPIIGQAAVPVFADDDAAALSRRILAEEHRLYPACVRLLCEGKARLGEDGLVRLAARAGPPLRYPA
jgi:phosphoribosylglycinamide formyltransferase-1